MPDHGRDRHAHRSDGHDKLHLRAHAIGNDLRSSVTMYWECFLRMGIVYLPTTGVFERGPLYLTMEPVTVIPVSDSVALHRAFIETLARGNPKVSESDVSDPSPPAVIKYAGVKTWRTFVLHADLWGIDERNGTYKIDGYRRDSPDGWVPDTKQAVVFPAGTTADDVIERMIAILQNAARENSSK